MTNPASLGTTNVQFALPPALSLSRSRGRQSALTFWFERPAGVESSLRSSLRRLTSAATHPGSGRARRAALPPKNHKAQHLL